MTGDGPRIVIAGGGTGGHLYPGIAVARALIARRPDARVSFAGTAQGLEARVAPREGFELDVIRSAGLKGKSLASRLRGAALVPLSVVDAWRLVSKRRPQLVIGVGGYSAGPTVLVAALRGTPTLLLEQNAVPGLTNRLLAPVVKAAAVTFESTRTFFGDKAFVSGNPVRPEFFAPAELQPAGPAGAHGDTRTVEVLVFGGSQGAHAINVAMVAAAERLAAGGQSFHLTHQTGERDVELVREGYRSAGLAATVEPYLYDMAQRMIRADVIVSRAGATTLAEMTAAGKAAILIPLPTATDDHQRKNAAALASAGAAEVLLQSDMTGPVLADRILGLVRNGERRHELAQAARAMARPDAAGAIVDRALALIELSGA